MYVPGGKARLSTQPESSFTHSSNRHLNSVWRSPGLIVSSARDVAVGTGRDDEPPSRAVEVVKEARLVAPLEHVGPRSDILDDDWDGLADRIAMGEKEADWRTGAVGLPLRRIRRARLLPRTRFDAPCRAPSS